jgi:hypothetical protein
MRGFPISRRRLFLLVVVTVVSASALTLAACSSGSDSSASDQSSQIGIQTSQLSVTIENKAGMPVTDVDVTIMPIGGATSFKKFIARMENAEKRDLALGEFFGDDGTPFNLRVVRPKSVRVTAKDLNSKPVKAELAWK